MGSGKRERKKANRAARAERDRPLPPITDDQLAGLLADVTVRADGEHASTRSSADSMVLIRCAVGASVMGGCARDCPKFEKRRVGGIGLGLGAG
jgi:hypothetical protein